MDPEDQLQACLEVFYEEQVEPKVLASKNVLQYMMSHQNLEYLIQHEQFLSTISRILRDEHKKNNELTLNLLCCFYILSNYIDFHPLLGEHQIGNITMMIIEHQIQRFDVRYAELMEKRDQVQPQELRKLNLMIAKQEKIFYVGFTILMNMAEDPIIENKMRKRKIITFLLRMLERNNFYLLIVSLLFLKKMSIVSECKQQIFEEQGIRKLKRFFTADNNVLLQLSLGLMKNLCFDSECRLQMEQYGYIPEIVKLLKVPNFRFLSIIILYQLTLDDKIRFTFGFTDCMNLIIKLILHFPEQHIGKELIALAINLSQNSRNVDHISEPELTQVIQRALQNQDVLLFKFIKGVIENSTNPEVLNGAKNFTRHFLKIALTQGKEDDLKYEIIGILSALKLEDMWVKFLNDSLLEFLHNNLASGMIDEDIILETLVLVQQIAHSPKAAEILAKNRILQEISQLYVEKVEDDEFVYQYLLCLNQFLIHKIGIEMILDQDDILESMLRLINDKNPKMRTVVMDVLDILREYDQKLNESIKEAKFFEYNQLWMEHVNEQQYEMIQTGQDLELNDDYGEQGLDPRMWDSDND